MPRRTSVHGPHPLLRSVLPMLLTLGVSTAALHAQPVLNVKRVINNWPTIEVYFSAGCNGTPLYPDDRSLFRLRENGRDIPEFTLWCPDPRVRCAASVGLGLDASASMMGAPNQAVRDAAHAFVSLFDGANDEAAVLYCSDRPVLAQQMTRDPGLLGSAITRLPSAGQSMLLDGVLAALDTLIASGTNQCRAVIFLSDGRDHGSTATLSSVIARANRNRIRVFTIGLGAADPSLLAPLADLTGGRMYIAPNPSQLVLIFNELTTIIFQGFQECLVTYNASCPDGSQRDVTLGMVNTCGGDSWGVKSYRAIIDSAGVPPATLRCADMRTRGGARVRVPVRLDAPAGVTELPPCTIDIRSDASVLRITGAGTDSTVAQAQDVQTAAIPGGVRITVLRPLPRSDAMPLFTLDGDAADPPPGAALSATIHCDAPLPAYGCLRMHASSAAVTVDPRTPLLTTELLAPAELHWDAGSAAYDPDTIRVRARITTAGDRAAVAVRAAITIPAALAFVPGEGPVQYPSPSALAPGESVEAVWLLHASRRLADDSASVTVDISATDVNAVSVVGWIGLPAPPSIHVSGSTSPCDGGSVVLRASAGYTDVQWWSGERADSIIVTSSGVYAWSGRDRLGRLRTSEPRTVTVLPLPLPVITVAGFPCDGDAVLAEVSGRHVFLQWSDGASGVRRMLRAPGAWAVFLRDSNGCGAWSDTLLLPSITRPEVRIAGPVRMCAGGDTMYTTAVPSGATVQWLVSGGSILGSRTADTVRVRWGHGPAGWVQARLHVAGSLCEYRTQLPVTLDPWTRPYITVQGALTPCDGSTVVLHAHRAGSDPRWNTGERGTELTVSRAGIYYLIADATVPCLIGTDTVVITHAAPPLPHITGPATACRNGVSDYRIDSSASSPCTWSATGGTVLGVEEHHTVSILWGDADTGRVVVFQASGGCIGGDTLLVLLRGGARTTVTRTDTVLWAAPGTAWQWLRNGIDLPGETRRWLRIRESGIYEVLVTDSLGCTTRSYPYDLVVGAPAPPSPSSADVHLYPDPTDGMLTIVPGRPASSPVVVSVIDLIGRVRVRKVFTAWGAPAAIRLDVRDLPSGPYLLHVAMDDAATVRAFLRR